MEQAKSAKFLLWAMQSFVIAIFVVLPGIAVYFYFFVLYSGDDLQVQKAGQSNKPAYCFNKELKGSAGATFNLRSSLGEKYFVKAPSDYKKQDAYPLLVVFAPNFSASIMERFVGLTGLGTKKGFIVAYVDGTPLNLKAVESRAVLVEEITEQWCINPEKIYFTGHSDGGSISQSLVFLKHFEGVAAIAPSAAGIRLEDLQSYGCPKPTSIFLMHNKKDTLFPDFGESAIRWWAGCNQCEDNATKINESCVQYRKCTQNVETIYCEGEGGHASWPKFNEEMLDFFERNKLRPQKKATSVSEES